MSQRTPWYVYVGGLALTGVFYATVPWIPHHVQPLVQRYFCSHPIEYLCTLLFFTGMAVLLQRLWSMRSERAVVRQIATQGDSPADGWCTDLAPRQLQTAMATRVHDSLRYVESSGAQQLESHLRYLAELAAERLHQSYALIRTITWAIPILGFLGTVMGITIAIANLTPEQLDSSLPEVVGGLEAAFDTTALALGMSIVLVFAAFATERGEQHLLNEVEQFGIDHLLPQLAQPTAATLPFPQADVWSAQCDQLQTAWSETLNRHFSLLSDGLQLEMEETLSAHRQSADAARDALRDVVQAGAAQYADSLNQGLQQFGQRVELWQQAMLTSSTAAAEQTEMLHQLGRTLLQLHESEERLAALQSQLNQNLQAVQTVDTLEQAVSSLSAAVNLLTTKTAQRSAA